MSVKKKDALSALKPFGKGQKTHPCGLGNTQKNTCEKATAKSATTVFP
jgi:hypothetical protein